MGIFRNWPYTNFHDLNLDRILERTKEAEEAVKASEQYVQDAAADMADAVAKATQAVNTANLAQGIAINARDTANTASTVASNADTKAGNALTAANANKLNIIPITLDTVNYTFEIDVVHSALILNGLIQSLIAGTTAFSFDATPFNGVYENVICRVDNLGYDPDDLSAVNFAGTAFVVAHEGSPESSNIIYPIMFEGYVDRSTLEAEGAYLPMDIIAARL